MSDQNTNILLLLGEIKGKVDNIEREVVGGEQPGLKQRVESLEATENKRTGALAVLGAIWVGAESWFHFFKGGK